MGILFEAPTDASGHCDSAKAGRASETHGHRGDSQKGIGGNQDAGAAQDCRRQMNEIQAPEGKPPGAAFPQDCRTEVAHVRAERNGNNPPQVQVCPKSLVQSLSTAGFQVSSFFLPVQGTRTSTLATSEVFGAAFDRAIRRRKFSESDSVT